MMMFSRRRPSSILGLTVLTVAIGLTHFSIVSAQRPTDRPEVEWVNKGLPESRGLTHHVLQSEAMGRDVGYVVYTPQGFDPTSGTRYPVIYFLHGMGGNEVSDSAGYSSRVAAAIEEGILPPTICVFPNGGRSFYQGSVEQMIVAELIPTIDKEYPTIEDAKGRLVVGFSMGGAGSVRLSMMHPQLFGAAGSWGGGLWRGADEIVSAARAGAAPLKQNGFSALLINGDEDRPDAFDQLAKVLSELDVPHEVLVLKETPHSLGLYYERSGDKMMQFLGSHLRSGEPQ